MPQEVVGTARGAAYLRGFICWLIVILMAASLHLEPAGAQSNTSFPSPDKVSLASFSDIPEGYEFRPFIRYLVGRGIISGFPDGSFKPDKGTTRAEAAKMLALAAGLSPLFPSTPTFQDVPRDHWAYGYVEAAVAAGLIKGYPDKNFRPDFPVTNAEAAVLLLRLSKSPVPETVEPAVADISREHWAYPEISAVIDANIISPANEHQFSPNAAISRASLARGISIVQIAAPARRNSFLGGRVLPEKGLVYVREPNETTERRLTDEKSVRPGQLIRTGSGGIAQILFDDGSGIRLGPDTEVEIVQMRGVPFVTPEGEAGSAVDLLEINLKTGVIFGALASHALYKSASRAVSVFRMTPATTVSVKAPSRLAYSAAMPVMGSSLLAATSSPTSVMRLGTSPSSLYADGRSTVRVRVQLLDSMGRPLGAPRGGVAVRFTTSAGRAWPEKVTIPEGQSSGEISLIAPSELPPNRRITVEAMADSGLMARAELSVLPLPWWRSMYAPRVRVRVNMPWGVAGIRGTFWKNEVTPLSHVTSVLEGEAEMTSAGQTVKLTAGERTEVTAPNTPPEPPRPLRAAELKEWEEVKEWVKERSTEIEKKLRFVPTPKPIAPVLGKEERKEEIEEEKEEKKQEIQEKKQEIEERKEDKKQQEQIEERKEEKKQEIQEEKVGIEERKEERQEEIEDRKEEKKQEIEQRKEEKEQGPPAGIAPLSLGVLLRN